MERNNLTDALSYTVLEVFSFKLRLSGLVKVTFLPVFSEMADKIFKKFANNK